MATVLRSERSQSIGTTPTAIGGYSAPSVTTGVYVTGLSVANTSGASVTVTVDLWTGSVATNVVKGATVVVGGAVMLADDGNRIVLNSGDQVRVTSSAVTSLDAIMSVAEIT